jgi:hypothetical protein
MCSTYKSISKNFKNVNAMKKKGVSGGLEKGQRSFQGSLSFGARYYKMDPWFWGGERERNLSLGGDGS